MFLLGAVALHSAPAADICTPWRLTLVLTTYAACLCYFYMYVIKKKCNKVPTLSVSFLSRHFPRGLIGLFTPRFHFEGRQEGKTCLPSKWNRGMLWSPPSRRKEPRYLSSFSIIATATGASTAAAHERGGTVAPSQRPVRQVQTPPLPPSTHSPGASPSAECV